jgi:hypothetical protein
MPAASAMRDTGISGSSERAHTRRAAAARRRCGVRPTPAKEGVARAVRNSRREGAKAAGVREIPAMSARAAKVGAWACGEEREERMEMGEVGVGLRKQEGREEAAAAHNLSINSRPWI